MKFKSKVSIIMYCFAAIVAISVVNSKITNQKSNSENYLSILISEAYAVEESTCTNTGPASSHTCGKTYCNFDEKWCDCRNEYCCTEKYCPNHAE